MIKIFKSLVRSTLVLFGPFWSYLIHMVLISAFSPIQSILSTKVLFSPLGLIQSTSVLSAYSVHIGSSRSILVLFCPLQSYSIHIGPIRTILFTVVLFSPIQSILFTLVHLSPIRPIWSILVIFGPFCLLQFYSVHYILFSPLCSFLVHFGRVCLFQSNWVLFCPFFPLRSHSVHISLILSTSVLLGQHCLIWSILSTLVLFGPIRTEWNAKWKNSQRMRNMVESNALTCDDPRHFLL